MIQVSAVYFTSLGTDFIQKVNFLFQTAHLDNELQVFMEPNFWLCLVREIVGTP